MAENEDLQELTEETAAAEGETRQKILVADDEASIRRILETRLKMVGYDVVVAEDGEEAVVLCKAARGDDKRKKKDHGQSGDGQHLDHADGSL